MVHMYNGILLSHKKNEILPFTIARMDLWGIRLGEIYKSDGARPYTFTYMWNLKNKINLQTKHFTDVEKTVFSLHL